MRYKTLVALAAFSLCVLGGISAIDIDSASISINTETIGSPGMAQVTIHGTPSNTYIAVDGGSSSYSSWTGRLTPGHHIISVSAEDHYPAQYSFTTAENTKYTVYITLEDHTGFLSINVTPFDASVYVDGSRVKGTMEEIPVGKHSVSVKKFGFDEEKVPITILWQRTSTLDIELSASIFEIRSFKIRPERFNPANKGLYSRGALSFTVTAPGYGSIQILNAEGKPVHNLDLPVFRTWSQRFLWNGREDSGKALPDGDYKVVLSLWPLPLTESAGEQIPQLATPAQANQQATPIPSTAQDTSAKTGSGSGSPMIMSTKVTIDSSLTIVPSGTQAARPGLLYFADPKVAELLPGSAELVGCYPDGASLSLGFKIGDSVMLAVEGVFDAASGGGVAGSILKSIGRFSGADLGLFGRVAWSSATDPVYPGLASEAEIALPLALEVGSLRLGMAPGAVYDLRNESFAARVGAALWYESVGMNAGLSAQATFGSSAFMSPANPLYVAAEMRLLFDKLPFTLLFRLSGAFEPELASPAASVGFGVAW
ncbi:MAG TPA: FlgD immunoglobulin-like domain containing protein [Rectinemataceae bacterium]|nr:FlgD immunoglobulin-like domain containing protein [Rectinemataceae bacterium]